jgi:hypothetical protein
MTGIYLVKKILYPIYFPENTALHISILQKILPVLYGSEIWFFFLGKEFKLQMLWPITYGRSTLLIDIPNLFLQLVLYDAHIGSF